MIPRKLRIKGHIFSVRQVLKSKLPKDCHAYVDLDKNHICLNKSLPASRKIECVFHEVLHGMLQGHNLMQEEQVCLVLGECFVEFIRDNPDFIRHCLKTLEQS